MYSPEKLKESKLIVAVIGSRSFADYALLKKVLDEKKNSIDGIVSGAAIGTDTLARRWADENEIAVIEINPDYKRYGRGAPIIRNRTIVDTSDMVIAFWDGTSRGTKMVIDYAGKQNKEVVVINVDLKIGGKL